MASSHNVVLLVDAADLALKDKLKLLALRLLNFLTCRAGLGQVRWSYRFLNSLGGRCRHPRRSDMRELGPRSWDDFEEELEACWEKARSGRCSTAPSSRAALTHTALMETLSDFQWDQPDITSPTKPAAARGRRGGRLIAVDEPMQTERSSKPQGSGGGCRNAVFILSPCPHSRAQLADFAAASHDIGLQQVMDKLLPKRLQNVAHNKRVVLYWLDTSDWTQVLDSCDHFGYWTMVELMQLVGGRIVPSESLLGLPCHHVAGGPFASGAAPKIPFDSLLGSLVSNELEYKAQFPQQNGIVYLMTPGVNEQWECAVTLDPISITQKYSKGLMTIHLKGTMQNWKWNQGDPLTLETWVLQDLSNSSHAPCLHFQRLLRTMLSKGLLLVADVCTETSLMPRTGILSPISETAAVLNVIVGELSIGLDRLCFQETVAETTENITSDLPNMVNSVLSHVYSCDETTASPDIPMAEWIKQELSQSNHWSSSVIEKWYPISGTCGASSNLMESFRLISAAPFEQDELKYDQEISNYLSDFYQKKSSDESGGVVQGDNQKKRLPRTPVRQKMKTMPRALQMLNTARLNLKAQKSQPEGIPGAVAEKVKRRSSEKPEKKPKKQTGFKSEEELICYLIEDYDKTVSGKDNSLLSCVRNALSTIKSYLKSVTSKQMEVDCIKTTRRLLKTSKIIRQQYGQNTNKEAKLRECQLQALIRLEVCVQCSSIQSNEDEIEQVVEEITDMLRIISLTEDPSFLTTFLAHVLAEYIGSIPRILADIYFSLGTQIPKELAFVLPADGDDCLLYEGTTPMFSQPSISRVPSLPQIDNEEDQLEELRTRSAKKRRTSTMTRHRSIAESSQSMRQIELPKKLMHKEGSTSNLVVMVERLKLPLQAQPLKEAEATKVRRNLFVQENRSPTKRGSKMPRSQSVSAVEEMSHKRSKTHDGTRDHYKLLTKKVTETPVHKQLANRLIHKQIKGRNMETTSNINVVEESPEKDIRELDLRRSPRIKQLSLMRRNSSFYASQPTSRNLERVHLSTQQLPAGDHKGNATSSEKKSPKRLLFGEILQQNSPPTRRARRRLLNDTEHLTTQMSGKCQRHTPRKTPQKSSHPCEEPLEKNKLSRKSPCTPSTTVCAPKTLKTPSKSPVERRSAAKNLGKIFSPSKLDEKSPLKLCERKSERLAQITPSKHMSPDNCFISPSKSSRQPFTPQKESSLKTPKSVLKTPTTIKPKPQLMCTPHKSPRLQSPGTDCFTPSRYHLRTPQKFVHQTPKKSVDGKPSVLSCLTECTPKKEKLCSPRRQAPTDCSMSPNISPCFKTSALGLFSVPQCHSVLTTPKKSQLKNIKPDASEVTTDKYEMVPILNDTCHFTEVAAANKNLPLVTTSVLPRNVQLSSKVLSSGQKVSSASKVLSSKGDLIVLSERLDISSLESSEDSESFAMTSQTDESIDISEAKIVQTEASDLKMKFLITRKSSDTSLMNSLPSTPNNVGKALCNSPYGLRHTVDRRQREAAARLGTPQIPVKFSTPKSQKKKNDPPPVYEVQLEMQDSGLPKLRFKRTDSNQTIDIGSQTRVEESPTVSRNRKGNESPFGESWCNRHAMKFESTCVSPYLRSCHNTPGKIQAFICQSYTPNRCSSNTASPIQADVAGPWTPSPKHEKNASDIINNWPRKKKATAVKVASVPRSGTKPDNTSSAPSTDDGSIEQEVNKSSPFEELLLDGGIFKLEQSPVIEFISKSKMEPNVVKCKKRCFELLSPTKETQSDAKRSCTFTSTYEVKEDCVSSSQSLSSNMNSSQDGVCEDEVFTISGFTPPNKVLKNSLSASGLFSLTQSPMLFKGRTPSSKRKLQDGESQHSTPEMKRAAPPSNLDESPFGSAPSRRSISRTYTRKKLIT